MTNFVFSFLGLPLIVILILNLLSRKAAEKLCLPLGYLVSLAQIGAAIAAIALLMIYHKDAIIFSMFWNYQAAEGSAYFAPDIFSFVALLSIGIVACASFLTAANAYGKKVFYFCNVMMVLILGMNGIALASDLFTLYVFMEVTGISAYLLIALQREVKGLEGAFKYLVMGSVASAFFLCGLALIFLNSGSLKFDDLAAFFVNWKECENPSLVAAALILIVSGLSIKAGLIPFQGWLPDAYQSSSAPTSVVLAGVTTKMAGVYGILRILNSLVMGNSPMNNALMLLGLVSIIGGAVAAMGQHNYKRILAYSSISQIGYIVLGASCSSLLGYLGAILHFCNHAVFKSALFVGSAQLESNVGTLDIRKLGGLQKNMPLTAFSSIIALLSAAGIPPMAGFWSKLLIIIAVWQSFGGWTAGLAMAASLLTAGYFLKLQRQVFWGDSKPEFAEVSDKGLGIRIATVSLTSLTILIGLLFPVLLRLFQTQGWV